MRRVSVLLLALLVLPVAAPAQSLGEVAAQEKARREKEKAKETGKKPRPAKTYTDDDLVAGASREKTEAPPPEPPYIPSTPTSSGTEGSEGQSGEEASGPQAQWRQRAADARQSLANARQQQEAAQQEVERISQDLSPLSLTYTEDVNTILRLQSELTQAQSRLEAVKQQVVASERAYKDFEDEARRQGVPSSWLQ